MTVADRQPYTILMTPAYRARIAHVVGHIPLLTVARLMEEALEPRLRHYESLLREAGPKRRITRVRKGRPVGSVKRKAKK